MLEDEQGNHDDGLDEASPSISLTSPRKSRLRAQSGVISSSDYMQQSRRNFVSYGMFLASYWDHLPQTLTRALGKKQRPIHDTL